MSVSKIVTNYFNMISSRHSYIYTYVYGQMLVMDDTIYELNWKSVTYGDLAVI